MEENKNKCNEKIASKRLMVSLDKIVKLNQKIKHFEELEAFIIKKIETDLENKIRIMIKDDTKKQILFEFEEDPYYTVCSYTEYSKIFEEFDEL